VLALRAAAFTLLVPGTVTVAVPAALLLSGAGLRLDLGPPAFVGLAPLAVGVALYLWCVSDFVLRGRGTPAPIDAPKELVSRGLYRFVRNPMYVGVAMILLGEVLLLESLALLAYAALVCAAFHLFVVLYEEPNLRRRFGEPYVEYCRSVPRWLPRPARSAS
jgi:protein-S-isoprenylcysteine O-methyltransferase Ste14